MLTPADAIKEAATTKANSDTDSEPGEDTFDPGPIDPEQELDLFPPDRHDKWANVRQDALNVGDVEITQCIVALVTYGLCQVPIWTGLSFNVIKELCQALV